MPTIQSMLGCSLYRHCSKDSLILLGYMPHSEKEQLYLQGEKNIIMQAGRE